MKLGTLTLAIVYMYHILTSYFEKVIAPKAFAIFKTFRQESLGNNIAAY